MRFRSSPSASPIRSAWLARLALCRAWSPSLAVCRRLMRRLARNAVWLVDAVAVSSVRPTLAPLRSLLY